MVHDDFWENILLTQLLLQNRPLFNAFWDFTWPKTRHHGLKMG